jgi:pimeloyl-ACP methyl ester carboxylesterase
MGTDAFGRATGRMARRPSVAPSTSAVDAVPECAGASSSCYDHAIIREHSNSVPGSTLVFEPNLGRRARAVCIAVAAALQVGCAALMPAPAPLRTVEYKSPLQPAKCLFVLLPGRGDDAERFRERGLVEDLQNSKRSIDIRAVDATMGYYMRGTLLDRLEADVITPAKARGYEEIWLVGSSMGGLGSLLYSRVHSAEVTGVLAIAPFLGDEDLIDEIAAAGGLKPWQAPPRVDAMSRDNYQRELWRWLQAVTLGREAAPAIFLGHGTSDRLSRAGSLLAEALPASRVFLTTGGHEWPAWRRVLASFLQSPEFSTHCR